ncbi:hypothetical protein FQA39_LY06111 [Lamprigera yunnana]|nr:hypothetical protein FQA39_LY06111 [Lamprigera yunnana]
MKDECVEDKNESEDRNSKAVEPGEQGEEDPRSDDEKKREYPQAVSRLGITIRRPRYLDDYKTGTFWCQEGPNVGDFPAERFERQDGEV